MKIVKYNHLTKIDIENFTNILSQSFCHNQFVFNYLMGANPKNLRKFMKMVVEYNNHFADYYALINNDGKWVAAVIYLPNGCEPIGIGSALKRRKLLTVLGLFIAQPIKYTKRMIKFSDLENRNWGKEPFVTLDMLASIEKGCGKVLIEATMENYNGQNIALNSSVDKNDHAYYVKFGFEPYAEFFLDHHKTVMMIKRA